MFEELNARFSEIFSGKSMPIYYKHHYKIHEFTRWPCVRIIVTECINRRTSGKESKYHLHSDRSTCPNRHAIIMNMVTNMAWMYKDGENNKLEHISLFDK